MQPTVISNSQVIGQVTDGSGNPINQAGVAVSKSSVGVPEILVLTDEGGDYKWVLPAGEFTLTVIKDGYLENSQVVTLKQGQEVKLNFQLKSTSSTNL